LGAGFTPVRLGVAVFAVFASGGVAFADLAAGDLTLATEVGLAGFFDFPVADLLGFASVAADLVALAPGLPALAFAGAAFADSVLVGLIAAALVADVFDFTAFAVFATAAVPEAFDAVLALGFSAAFDAALVLPLVVDPLVFPADAAIAGLWLLSFD